MGGHCLYLLDDEEATLQGKWSVQDHAHNKVSISFTVLKLRLCDIQIFLPSRYTRVDAAKVSQYTSRYTIHKGAKKYHDTRVDARCMKKANVKTRPIYKTSLPDQYC